MQKLKITKPRFGKQAITFPIIGKTQIDADNSFEVEDNINAEELKTILEGSNIFIELPESKQEPEATEPIAPAADPSKDETPKVDPVIEGAPAEDESQKTDEPVKEDAKPSKEELIEIINSLDKKEMLEYIKTEMPDTISMQKAGPLGEEKLRTLIISSL